MAHARLQFCPYPAHLWSECVFLLVLTSCEQLRHTFPLCIMDHLRYAEGSSQYKLNGACMSGREQLPTRGALPTRRAPGLRRQHVMRCRTSLR